MLTRLKNATAVALSMALAMVGVAAHAADQAVSIAPIADAAACSEATQTDEVLFVGCEGFF